MSEPTPYQEDPGSINFHDQVIRGIARLEVKLALVCEKVDKINGNVATAHQKINTLEIDLVAHPLTCTSKSKVDEIATRLDRGEHPGAVMMQQRLASLETLAQENKAKLGTSLTWLRYLLPVIYLIISGITLLILYHSKELLDLRFGVVK